MSRPVRAAVDLALLVSLLDTLAAVSLTLSVAIPAAYAFERRRFRFRRPLYLFVVACIPLALDPDQKSDAQGLEQQ